MVVDYTLTFYVNKGDFTCTENNQNNKNSNLVISHNELVYRSISAHRFINLVFLHSHHAANPEPADLVAVRERKALLHSYPSLRPHCVLSHSE